MKEQPVQTYLTEYELETLQRVINQFGLERQSGRPSPTGVTNVKRGLQACVSIAGWLLETGITPPAHVVERHNGAE